MTEKNHTEDAPNYKAVSKGLRETWDRAQSEYVAANPVDQGACGWACLVIDDTDAAEHMQGYGFSLVPYSGYRVRVDVRCSGQQSADAAAHVANAMSAYLSSVGIKSHFYGRID